MRSASRRILLLGLCIVVTYLCFFRAGNDGSQISSILFESRVPCAGYPTGSAWYCWAALIAGTTMGTKNIGKESPGRFDATPQNGVCPRPERYRQQFESGPPRTGSAQFPPKLTSDYYKANPFAPGERPLQVLLISTWRTGSSFTGKLLTSLPDTLYYFEPIFFLPGFRYRIQGPPQSDEAITLLRSLLDCNHSLLTVNDGMMNKPAYFLPVFNSSTAICGEKCVLCRKPEFTEALCRKSPFHLMKLVRLHLSLVESFLADDSLNIMVLYLVRDPRGTLNSRWQAKFLGHYDCTPSVLCADLVTEFYAAKRLQEKYSNRFRVVRYEDLAENVSKATEGIFSFLGHAMHPRVVEYIEKHTQEEGGAGNLGTKRNSSYTATKWTEELSLDQITLIQNNTVCRKALRLWGYKTVTNSTLENKLMPYLNRAEYDFEQRIKQIV